jgi:integrase
LAQLADAFVGFPRAQPLSASALSRLAYWREALGDRPVIQVTADEVDAALARLQARGRLRPRRNGPSVETGQPLKASTTNRYISSLGELFRHARRLRIVPRSHISPLQGIERQPEHPDPERYLRPEEVERLLRAARVVDRQWGRLRALILLAFTTGIRRGNLQALKWADIDIKNKTATIPKTKNGRPIVSPLVESVIEELKKLPRPTSPQELVFAGRFGRAHGFRRLWIRACNEASLPGRTFHMLRHGCATALAIANVNQAQIMATLGHRTLSASARYLHHSIAEKRAVIEKVFGQ